MWISKYFFLTDDLDPCLFGTHALQEIPATSIGWLFPKNSILKPLFDWFYRRKREHGVVQKLYEESFKDKIGCSADAPFNSIDIQIVALLFLVLSVGIVLAVIMLSFEKTNFTIFRPMEKFRNQATQTIK